MEFILLLVVFIVLGVLATFVGQVVRNLIYLVIIIALGMEVWFRVLPYFFGDKVHDQIRTELNEQTVGKFDDFPIPLDLNPESVDQLFAIKPELSDIFIREAKKHIDKLEQIDIKVASGDAPFELPDLPAPEQFQDLDLDQQEVVKLQIVQALSQQPDTEINDPTPEPEQPRELVSRGQLTDELSIIEARGSATVQKIGDTSVVLRLEDFFVSNGPDLAVYLSVSPIGEVGLGYVDLGALKGNKGNQTYFIESTADVSKFKSVIIYSTSLELPYAVIPLR